MRDGPANRSWFALLRRDRLLFAIAAAVLAVVHLLQPSAGARAAGLDVGATICSLGSATSPLPAGNHDPAADHCPQCVAGPRAGLALAQPAGLAATVLRPRSGDAANPALRTAGLPRKLAGEPPPPIRAPPFSV